MSVSLSFNQGQARTLDRAVRRVDVYVGSLSVSDGEDSILIEAGEAHEFDDVAGLTLQSPTSAKVAVTYFDEPAVRGDSGGSGGSYESRTLKELQALARERGMTGYSELNKTELIGELRG